MGRAARPMRNGASPLPPPSRVRRCTCASRTPRQKLESKRFFAFTSSSTCTCLLYTSDAADDM
eukprot:6665088-Prymnesium_polylepis.2